MAKVAKTREKTKTTGFFFKMSPQEWEWVERRMAETNIRNKSAFIRKMCIDGHVIIFDSEKINEIGRLLRITANNANQIAKGVNYGFGADREDVAEVNNQLSEIRTMFGDLLSALTEVTNAKPGSRFILPPNISDYIVQSEEEQSPPIVIEGA
jgi:hypothetical protein